jgi:hypothetical protein
VLAVLLEAPEALGVNYEKVYGCAVGGSCVDGLRPDPESFGTGIDSRAHSEPRLPIQNHPIQQIRFSRPVQARYGNHSQWFLEPTQKLLRLLLENILYIDKSFYSHRQC